MIRQREKEMLRYFQMLLEKHENAALWIIVNGEILFELLEAALSHEIEHQSQYSCTLI